MGRIRHPVKPGKATTRSNRCSREERKSLKLAERRTPKTSSPGSLHLIIVRDQDRGSAGKSFQCNINAGVQNGAFSSRSITSLSSIMSPEAIEWSQKGAISEFWQLLPARYSEVFGKLIQSSAALGRRVVGWGAGLLAGANLETLSVV